MAWYDDITSGGISGLLGTDAPNYLNQMFPLQAEQIKNKAIQSGLIGGLGAYLRAPKNQNRGIGALVGDVLGGYQQGAQNMYNKQVSDYITGQKLSELQTTQQNKEKLKEAIAKYNQMPLTANPEDRAKFYTENVIPYLDTEKQAEAMLPKVTTKEVGDKLYTLDQYGRVLKTEAIPLTKYQQESLSIAKMPMGYERNPAGGIRPIAGGPADVKAQTQLQGANDFDTQINNLRSSYRQLGDIGGITSTSKDTLHNLIASASSSDIGQFASQKIGTQAQSIRNQIAQSRPLLLQSIKQATGMSSKQMDSNAELQMYLRAATDPKLDLEANLAALDNLEKLYGTGRLNVAGAKNVETQNKPVEKQIVKTGVDKKTGRKVVQYSDGTTAYAN